MKWLNQRVNLIVPIPYNGTVVHICKNNAIVIEEDTRVNTALHKATILKSITEFCNPIVSSLLQSSIHKNSYWVSRHLTCNNLLWDKNPPDFLYTSEHWDLFLLKVRAQRHTKLTHTQPTKNQVLIPLRYHCLHHCRWHLYSSKWWLTPHCHESSGRPMVPRCHRLRRRSQCLCEQVMTDDADAPCRRRVIRGQLMVAIIHSLPSI